MYCTNCGEEVAENAVICVKCGVVKGTEKKHCYSCSAAINENQVVCVKCGVPLTPQKQETQSKRTNSVPVPAGAKNRMTAGILALTIGAFGGHKFYLGKTMQHV